MINVCLRKHGFYLLGIVLFAFVINLGTAFNDVMIRMKQPLFQQVLVATVVMLYLYLYSIQKIYHYLFFDAAWFISLNPVVKGGLFVIVSAGLITLIHISILNFLLAQRNHGSILTFDYFITDFWFFFVPLLSYVIVLYLKPYTLLFKLPEINTDEISVDNDPVDQEIQQSIITPLEINQKDELINIWRMSRVKSFVFDYFQKFSEKEKAHLDDQIPLWKVVMLEKSEMVTFGYFINGEKWGLDHMDDSILSNPWLVKISQNCYVNMLYVIEGLSRRSQLKMKLKKENALSKEVTFELVMLHEEIRKIMEKTTGSDRLEKLLMITRRMKVNYKKFWDKEALSVLDENKLMANVGTIHGKAQ
ncbi:hypothetical protein [Sphingobacterium faecium]|uniref:hypothetical protein n=1 Tax=Sphingobacterium faecium TaxID=34087 RepID=UPI003207D2E6